MPGFSLELNELGLEESGEVSCCFLQETYGILTSWIYDPGGERNTVDDPSCAHFRRRNLVSISVDNDRTLR